MHAVRNLWLFALLRGSTVSFQLKSDPFQSPKASVTFPRVSRIPILAIRTGENFRSLSVAFHGVRDFFTVHMLKSKSSPERSPSLAVNRREPARVGVLIVIDQRRLQAAAWAELHTARKRLEKAARDLQRHEEIDVPAYDSWLHRLFPRLVTLLRELHAEVTTKAHQVQLVQAMSAYSGGSLKRLWREQKAREAQPETSERNDDDASFRPDDPDVETSSGQYRHEARDDDFPVERGPTPSSDARAIYRRLVQRLHPDRGGEWTAARQRLWHEVQQAWAAADTDWLARLEVNWEEAHEILGPSSALSRLRQAIVELHGARRDTERKLSSYRDSPAWRFTKKEKQRAALQERTEANFLHDIRFLQRQLDHLNATIAAWENDGRGPRRRPRAQTRWRD